MNAQEEQTATPRELATTHSIKASYHGKKADEWEGYFKACQEIQKFAKAKLEQFPGIDTGLECAMSWLLGDEESEYSCEMDGHREKADKLTDEHNKETAARMAAMPALLAETERSNARMGRMLQAKRQKEAAAAKSSAEDDGPKRRRIK